MYIPIFLGQLNGNVLSPNIFGQSVERDDVTETGNVEQYDNNSIVGSPLIYKWGYGVFKYWIMERGRLKKITC